MENQGKSFCFRGPPFCCSLWLRLELCSRCSNTFGAWNQHSSPQEAVAAKHLGFGSMLKHVETINTCMTSKRTSLHIFSYYTYIKYTVYIYIYKLYKIPWYSIVYQLQWNHASLFPSVSHGISAPHEWFEPVGVTLRASGK